MKSGWATLLVLLLWVLLFLAACFDSSMVPAATDETSEANQELYTCGMHPEVIQNGPGICPICKMDLTPLSPKNDANQIQLVKSTTGERKIKHWVAPMDPTYIRDSPGKSPMGMDLVPVYEEQTGQSANMSGSSAVTIDPVVVQNMGIRTAHANRMELKRSVRTIGEVVVPDEALVVVNLRYSGWIESIFADQTEISVKKGDPLFSIYSPELLQAQEEYLQALRLSGEGSGAAAAAQKRLDLMTGGSWLSRSIRKNRKSQSVLTVPSPGDGVILHKNVVKGSKVNAGNDLYSIGTLDTVWVQAEVYEADAPWIGKGQSVKLELPFQEGKTIESSIDYVYPVLDQSSRTLKIRIVLKNPDLKLKPGMFATAWIAVESKPGVLAVPTEAILRSGERRLVFVAKEKGKFEPREIVTGLTGDDHMTEVLSGLTEHEQVVTSGQFLLDSESQLQEAVNKFLADRLAAKAPAAVDAEANAEPKEVHDHQDAAYWTCPMHSEVVQDGPGQCPICKMDLVEKK